MDLPQVSGVSSGGQQSGRPASSPHEGCKSNAQGCLVRRSARAHIQGQPVNIPLADLRDALSSFFESMRCFAGLGSAIAAASASTAAFKPWVKASDATTRATAALIWDGPRTITEICPLPLKITATPCRPVLTFNLRSCSMKLQLV